MEHRLAQMWEMWLDLGSEPWTVQSLDSPKASYLEHLLETLMVAMYWELLSVECLERRRVLTRGSSMDSH